MMPRRRLFVRVLLALLLVGGCFAAILAPLLVPAQAAPYQAALPGNLLISQFRFIGTAGETDEFIELFNRGCTASTDVSLNGWSLRWSDGANNGTLYNFTGGTLAHSSYLLLVNTGFDTSGFTSFTSYSNVDIPSGTGGVALFAPGDTVPTDAVGFNQDGYHEGVQLTGLLGSSNQGYVRKTSAAGMYIDTNDNSADFRLLTVTTPHNSGDSGTCGNPTPVITGNVQAPNVTITYNANGSDHVVPADPTGNYTINVGSDWTGTVTVTPSRANFVFSPANRTYDASTLTSNLTGQNFDAVLTSPTSLSVLINEVAWGGTRANASDQWIELYNPNTYGVDMSQMQLIGTSGTIGTSGVLDLNGQLTNDVLKGHGFLVIEKNTTVFKNLLTSPFTCQGVTYTVDDMVDTHLALSTYGERLTLEGPSGQVDVADHLGYQWPAGLGGTLVAASNRASMERRGAVADSNTAWFTYAAANSPCGNILDANSYVIKGSPGEPNWAVGVSATPSPTPTHYKTPTPYPPTPFGHMVINEFLPRAGYDWNQDGTVDVYDEFVELKNLGPIAAQIGGWKLSVISPGGPSTYVLPNQTLQPGERAVFYGLKSNLSLYDSGGTIRLINSRGVIVDARSYTAVANPDQSTCRLPDGYYWRFPCFPTPGNENSETGSLPVPPPAVASQPAPCLMADTVPDPFKQAECYGFGAGIFNPAYWDDQSGFKQFPVPDQLNKRIATVQ